MSNFKRKSEGLITPEQADELLNLSESSPLTTAGTIELVSNLLTPKGNTFLQKADAILEAWLEIPNIQYSALAKEIAEALEEESQRSFEEGYEEGRRRS